MTESGLGTTGTELVPASVVELIAAWAARGDDASEPMRAASALLPALADAFAASRGSLMMLNPRTGRLRILAALGPRAHSVGENLPPAPRRISDRVLREPHGVILNGPVRDERFDSSVVGERIASAVCVPLATTHGPVAVLNLARTGDAACFTANDLRSLECLGPAIATLLARSEELSEAKHLLRRSHSPTAAHGALSLRSGELAHARIDGHGRSHDTCTWSIHADGTASVMLCEPFGHPVEAAMLGAWLEGAFRAFAVAERDPAALATALDSALRKSGAPAGSAARAWIGSLGLHGHLRSCAAGVPAPFAIPAEGEPGSRLLEGGPPLGASLEPAPYETAAVRLLPGDALLVVSDGVLEAEAPSGRLFTAAGVIEHLAELRRRPLGELVYGAVEAARAHADLRVPVDDLAALAFRFSRET